MVRPHLQGWEACLCSGFRDVTNTKSLLIRLYITKRNLPVIMDKSTGFWKETKGNSWETIFFNHGGHIGCKKVHPSNYFCIFNSFELKLCRMVELCSAKNPMFFVFRF